MIKKGLQKNQQENQQETEDISETRIKKEGIEVSDFIMVLNNKCRLERTQKGRNQTFWETATGSRVSEENSLTELCLSRGHSCTAQEGTHTVTCRLVLN